MANVNAVTGTNRDAANDLLNAGWTDQQIADWLKTRAPASEVSGFLGGPGPTASPLGATDMSPGGLAAMFKQPDVTLPRADEAKGAFRDLQLGATSGLGALMKQDPQAQRAALTKAMYDNAAGDINYQADRQGHDIKEGQNAKNMLQSTGTSYLLDPVERGRSVGLEKAANDAFTQANAIGNANQNTALTTLGQAFTQGSNGLQGDANVENANRAANQSATQAGVQTGAQLSENAASRAQQKQLQEESFQNSRDIASSNALAGGVAAGVGGLANLFGPGLAQGIKTQFF